MREWKNKGIGKRGGLEGRSGDHREEAGLFTDGGWEGFAEVFCVGSGGGGGGQ